MTVKYPYLVADIGGTNARFGLVTQSCSAGQNFRIENIQKYPSKQFENISQAVKHYINSLGTTTIHGACLAVAGPVETDKILLTNLNWRFSIEQLKRDLKLDTLQVINDFAAYALATRYISNQEIIGIKSGVPINAAPIAVIGPGTGFGVASLVRMATKPKPQWKVLASEGGHMSLAAHTELQSAVIDYLNRKNPFVTLESIFSGPGLGNLYEALSAVNDLNQKPLNASQISEIANNEPDSLAFKTFQLFCDWLGQSASDLAVTFGARGGVYLCGGILKKNADLLTQSNFTAGFTANPIMKNYLESIPVNLVLANNSALTGAAAYYQQ
ncbi:MAG: glucokinase [Enterobacterales bacterium]|nr:glucokinase [Enterobacterales bacterium]